MTTPIFLRVIGTPVAQPRPRATLRGRRAAVYNPSGPIDDWKGRIRSQARREASGGLLEGPIRVDAEFLFPRPERKVWKRKAMPRDWHTAKPDRDNLEKALLDALTGILWRDDSQVCAGEVQKFIAAGDESPGVNVAVYVLGEV